MTSKLTEISVFSYAHSRPLASKSYLFSKSGQNRAKSKNFLVPCDSRVHSEGIFIRPGSHLAGKHAHCELCYHSLNFRFFHGTF